MNILYKLSQHKMVLTVIVSVVFGLLLAPAVALGNAPDTFGTSYVEDNVELGAKDLRETAADIINVALGMLGIVAVVIILIGGFKWMTAGGNDEKVTEGRKWIFSGIIGLAIILSAWAIARFAISELSTATDSGNVPAGDDAGA